MRGWGGVRGGDGVRNGEGHAWHGGGGGMYGRRDSHCSGWYASYWNAFLYQFFVTLLTILYDVPIVPYEWKIKFTTFQLEFPTRKNTLPM